MPRRLPELTRMGPRRSRTIAGVTIAVSVLFHLLLLHYLRGVPLGIGSEVREAEDATLEVRVSNERAIALYRKLHMTADGKRARYYPDGEDAMIFSLRGLGSPEVRARLEELAP